MKYKQLDHYLANDQTKFKELINTLSEDEQIDYLNTIPINRSFVIHSIEVLTEKIIKNEIDKNPVCFYSFENIKMSDELVNYVFDKLKKSSGLLGSAYKESYIKSINLCKTLLNLS